MSDEKEVSAVMEVDPAHTERICQILKALSEALAAGRSAVVAIDCGEKILADCFSHPTDPTPFMLVNVLENVLRAKMPLAFIQHTGSTQ